MYYLALSEWGTTPDELTNNWTEEQLELMFRTRNKFMSRGNKTTADRDLFKKMGLKVKSI